MNLLQLLLGSLLSNNSVNSVSQKTGLSSKLVQKLLVMAIPLLIKYMTKNASNQNGALSLLNALTKHTNTRAVSQQIDDVDEEDGLKIIGHILGDDKDKVVQTLSAETGVDDKAVNKTLGTIAPALLSALSAMTNASKPQANNQGADLTSLLNMFAGGQTQAQQSTSLLSSLLGGASTSQAKPSSSNSTTALLNALLGGATQQKPQHTSTDFLSALLGGGAQQKPQANATTSLLSSLFGGQTQQQAQSSVDGTELLSLLTSLMK